MWIFRYLFKKRYRIVKKTERRSYGSEDTWFSVYSKRRIFLIWWYECLANTEDDAKMLILDLKRPKRITKIVHTE